LPLIGILGQKNDAHVLSLSSELESRGATVLIVDFYNFPRFNLLTLNRDMCYDDIHVLQPLPLNDLDLLFVRSFSTRMPRALRNQEKCEAQSAETVAVHALKSSFIRIMEERIPVINSFPAMLFHRLKPYQYFLLDRNGIPVPGTMVTRNPIAARRFIAAHEGRVVVKPLAGGAEVVMAEGMLRETGMESPWKRPFMFQQYVAGRSLRAYTLGGQVSSMGVVRSDEKRVDWRAGPVQVERVEPEEALKLQIAKAVKLLGLSFCSIDIEHDDSDGKYYLLDFNPGALFTGWERLTGINMAARIAEYLLRVVKNRGEMWCTGI
jgi:glutathione synthase/RimK-type ligase-like ATP-grasp enzyme